MSLPRMTRRRFAGAATLTAAAAVLGSRTAFADESATAEASAGTYVVPGEWAPQAGTLMAWPWSREIWGGALSHAQTEIAGIANTIVRFQPVIMAVMPETVAEVRRQVSSAVQIVEMSYDDCWTRDPGPIFAVNKQGTKMIGLDFAFNGWGGDWPSARDDTTPAGFCRHLGVSTQYVDMVFEGGSVLQDGEGTLITTEECLLNPNRNPGMTKAQIESTLLGAYGASKVIWLPYGLYGDTGTDGHVDLVVGYLAPAKVLFYAAKAGTPDEARSATNKAVLQESTDAKGRRFELVEIHDKPTPLVFGEVARTFSYANFYPTDTAVMVPQAGEPEDAAALALFRSLFPGKEVVGVPGRYLGWGGGGVHCVTQQIPRLS